MFRHSLSARTDILSKHTAGQRILFTMENKPKKKKKKKAKDLTPQTSIIEQKAPEPTAALDDVSPALKANWFIP